MKVGKKALGLTIAVLFALKGWAQVDSTGLDNLFGKKGTVTGNVYRITFPRGDLKVTIGDFPVAPGLALTSWVALHRMGAESMMMGDLVMLDSEEPAVVAKLVELGLGITAIHNHLVGEKPAIKFLHFSGSGDALKLAGEIKQVLAITGTPFGSSPAGAAPSPDWSAVEAQLGAKGRKSGNIISYSFPRKEKLMESGMEMPAPMGMATGINLQMDGSRAGTTGDFVLLADEVNKVVKALETHGITVTAIHNHMLYDEPRLFMLHFWGVGEPGKLAAGLKAALEETNSAL
ncbi:DUF1259 domain-containing protein [Puia dinghuensis]|uniref:Peptidoglycan-binding protein LysM n=1 Tax=Puia dinghuensis TaxID=1792502 RepID=A0A8J2UI54_9BACT|nr:DUF1259 domain-containing protein [Puia dinghuensis]GGB21146.1 peptidoglycan-binding protein LysM [Puia dinghuensis]